MAMRRSDPTCKRETPMPELAAPPDPAATATRPLASPDGTVPPMPFSSPDRPVPPMPSEITNARDRTKQPAEGGRWRTAMMPLRKMVRRTP
jgi:hypothetical protein